MKPKGYWVRRENGDFTFFVDCSDEQLQFLGVEVVCFLCGKRFESLEAFDGHDCTNITYLHAEKG